MRSTLRTALPFVTLITSFAAAFDAFADAPQFRGDAAHSGVYASASVPAFRLKWKFKTQRKVFSSPAVVDGTVFVGSSDHSVYALDAATGALRWRARIGGAVNSSPAVADGTVFAVS